MERDAAISHGASSFLRERLMLVSDGYQTVFCKTCGTFAVNDATTLRYRRCRLCGDDENFGRCVIPYAYKLLIQLLAAPGLNLRPEFISSEEYAHKVLTHREETGANDLNNIADILTEADQARLEEEEEIRDEEGLDTDFSEVYTM